MSTSEETLQKLILLAAKHFNKDAEALTPDADFFEALGVNSLQAMELLTVLEESFDVEVPDYELQGVTTFRALASIIESRL